LGFLNSDDYSSIKHVVRTTIDYAKGYLVSDDSYIALPDFTIILFKGKESALPPGSTPPQHIKTEQDT